MFLDGGKKQEYLKKIMEVWVGNEPKTFLLWFNHANHFCTTPPTVTHIYSSCLGHKMVLRALFLTMVRACSNRTEKMPVIWLFVSFLIFYFSLLKTDESHIIDSKDLKWTAIEIGTLTHFNKILVSPHRSTRRASWHHHINEGHLQGNQRTVTKTEIVLSSNDVIQWGHYILPHVK